MRPFTLDGLSLLWVLGSSAALMACHDWDKYDPLLGGDGSCSLPLKDTFDAPTTGSAWIVQDASGGTVAVAAQELVVSIPNTAAGSGASVASAGFYDLTGCRGFVELTQVPDPSTNAVAFMALEQDKDNALIILEVGGNLQAKTSVDGAQEILVDTRYDPVAHAYLGIREDGGITSWETSPDGKTWRSFWQAPNPLPPAEVHVRLAAFTYREEQRVPGEAHFDNLNLVP